MGVTNTTSGDPVPFTTTPVNPASVSSYMLINLPEAGTSYELSFASIITSHCGGVSIYSERWTNITRCTGVLPNVNSLVCLGVYSIKLKIIGIHREKNRALSSSPFNFFLPQDTATSQLLPMYIICNFIVSNYFFSQNILFSAFNAFLLKIYSVHFIPHKKIIFTLSQYTVFCKICCYRLNWLFLYQQQPLFIIYVYCAHIFKALNHINFRSLFQSVKYHDHVKNYNDQSKKSLQPRFS